jgi:hypothetical protein
MLRLGVEVGAGRVQSTRLLVRVIHQRKSFGTKVPWNQADNHCRSPK